MDKHISRINLKCKLYNRSASFSQCRRFKDADGSSNWWSPHQELTNTSYILSVYVCVRANTECFPLSIHIVIPRDTNHQFSQLTTITVTACDEATPTVTIPRPSVLETPLAVIRYALVGSLKQLLHYVVGVELWTYSTIVHE